MSKFDQSSDEDQESSSAAIEAAQFSAPGASIAKTPNSQQQEVPRLGRGVLAASEGAPWWHSQMNLMLAVFALLGFAVILFILVSPEPNVSGLSTRVSQDGETSEVAVGNQVVAPDTEVMPFSDAERAQARADSQEILSELLTIKKQLQQQQAEQWAEEEFNAALALATEGDALYQQQNYPDAIAGYKASVKRFIGIEERIPVELAVRVAAGQQAIKAGKSALARERFESALVLDRNHIPALNGLDRVKTLDQVLSLISAASQDEQQFVSTDQESDLQQAKSKYQQALQLDKQVEVAQIGLERVNRLIADKQYRVAMSDGFNALFARRYSAARSGFSAALKIKPDDSTANNALKQALASDQRSSLSSLLNGAKRFERQEEWSSALSNYQAVLQRDPNQVAAKLGKIRAQARGDLDGQIKQALADTLSWSEAIPRGKAEQALADAKAIKNKGPVLQQQINAMETAFKQLNSNINVMLISDSLTQVTLRKPGAKPLKLGRFSGKKLALKPGRYVLSGVRLGYRDVRTELVLQDGAKGTQQYIVACDEPIAKAG